SRGLTFDGQIVRVWDLTAGESLAPEGPAEDGATYSHDGRRLARVAGDTVQVYDTSKGPVPLGAAMKHKGEVQKVVFSPEGAGLRPGSDPRRDATTPTWDVRVWDAATGEPISEAMEHLREVRQASFVANGSRVLTAALDKQARLWDAKTGKQVGKSMDHPED